MKSTNRPDGQACAAEQTGPTRFPLPHIPALTANAEIDVDALAGADLETYVNFPGIQAGDEIKVIWRGSDEQGEPIDDIDAVTPVINPDPDNGVLVKIANRLLTGAYGGWVFYSYRVNDDLPTESMRQFCYVGLRSRPALEEQLAPVQALESHALVIDYSAMATAGATLYIPPYQAMQVGDQVTLLLNGEEQDGTPIREKTYDCSPQAGELGAALACQVRRTDWRNLVDGKAVLHYTVLLKGQADTLQSSEQVFAVQGEPASEPLLPAMSIVGFTGGDVLDPDAFANGLTLQAPCPAGVEAGDLVLCHWTGTQLDNRHTLALRLDASSLAGGLMQWQIDPKALGASVGDEVVLFFQIAREGWAMSSAPLVFKVERTRGPRPAPSVEKTTAEGAGNAVGSATDFNAGAWVNVPDSAVQPDDTVKVHWLGDTEGGRTVVEAPDDPHSPLRFKVPADFIAANMEQSNDASAKRFAVTYSVATSQGEWASEPLNLRIHPVPRNGYQQVLCDEADGLGNLSLGELTEDPHLVLHQWPFMAVGNQVTIAVSGVGEYQKTLRDAVPVSASELSQKMVVARVPLQDLRGLAANSRMTMTARISFDGGKTTHAVPDAFVSLNK